MIQLQLEILSNNKVVIPGCEPTSALTSKTLLAYQSQGCTNPLVDVAKILEAIPGSYVKYGDNFSRQGTVQRWLVLPARSENCPCGENVDYYNIIKSLAGPDEENICDDDSCSVVYRDFESKCVEEPNRDMYREEGINYQIGILPPKPDWS